MFYLYKWTNLTKNSPQESTRNNWLWQYGAFARCNGLWFPCRVTNYTTIGEPCYVIAIPIATRNTNIYPQGEIHIDNLDVLYTVFNNGLSIREYIRRNTNRKDLTLKMLDGALQRSLNTEIITAPKKLISQIKQVINRVWKGEIRVVDTNLKDEIQVIQLPHTANILDSLWQSYGNALQEVCQRLGISYNPSQGKKERLITAEISGDRDITLMNRELLTSRLRNSANEFNENVEHISNIIDKSNERGVDDIEI